MTIVRAPQDPHEGFTVLPNAALTDSRLSWKARGLLAHLLSKPPLWRTSSYRLANDGPDGRDAVRSGLVELEDAGYLVRGRYQDATTGRWSTVSTIYDRPCARPVDNSATEAGLSGAGEPGPSVNTEIVNTEVLVSTFAKEATVDTLCTTCNGGGWLHYQGEAEECPQCQAARA